MFCVLCLSALKWMGLLLLQADLDHLKQFSYTESALLWLELVKDHCLIRIVVRCGCKETFWNMNLSELAPDFAAIICPNNKETIWFTRIKLQSQICLQSSSKCLLSKGWWLPYSFQSSWNRTESFLFTWQVLDQVFQECILCRNRHTEKLTDMSQGADKQRTISKIIFDQDWLYTGFKGQQIHWRT